MSHDDNKAAYSKASKYYIENKSASDLGFNKSKEREKKHNTDWIKTKVNLNELIDHFSPSFTSKINKQKMIFFGERYNVITDMAGGYLRIYDNSAKTYVKLDGTPGNDKETHFKIKKREEM